MKQGNVILYFHGFASSPQSNKAVLFRDEFQKRGIQLIIPDLEGGDFRNLTISSQMDIIRRVIYENPSPKYGLIGSSMGGYLALLTAQLQPNVRALFLMCPGINFVNRWKKLMYSEYPDGRQIPGLIQVFNYRYNKVMELGGSLFEDGMIWEQVKLERQLPARLVHGIRDEVVPVEESRQYLKINCRAQLVELESDHGLLSHSKWIVNDAIQFFKIQGVLNQ